MPQVLPLRALCAGLLMLAAPLAGAAEALDAFLEQVQTLSGRFEQQQFDEQGEVIARHSGRVEIARPDRFRWAYEKPYVQYVISDGRTIWIYDPDLEQVTRRVARDALSGTPAALLSRERTALEGFRVESLPSDGDIERVRLLPTSAESDFREITVHLDGIRPVLVAFTDQLGGRTEIRLFDLQLNVPIDAGRFRFEVPAGTEVVDG